MNMTAEIQPPEQTPEMLQQDKERSRKFLMGLAILSMTMIFAALTSALLVRKNSGNWFQFDIPEAFTFSTWTILASSITLILAVVFTRKGKSGIASLFIFGTLALGIAFLFLQFEGYKALIANDIYFVDKESISGSFFYAITGMHLLHLIGGLFALLVTAIRSAIGKYTPNKYLGLKLCSIYWHFLGVLWVYLFLFLSFYQ